MTTNNTVGRALDKYELDYGFTPEQIIAELEMTKDDRYAKLREEPIPVGAMAGWRGPDGQFNFRPVIASPEGIEVLARRHGANIDKLREIVCGT